MCHHLQSSLPKLYLKMVWHLFCTVGVDRKHCSPPSHPSPCSLYTQTLSLWNIQIAIIRQACVQIQIVPIDYMVCYVFIKSVNFCINFINCCHRMLIHLSVSAFLSPRFWEHDVFMQQTRTIKIFSIKSRSITIFIVVTNFARSWYLSVPLYE